MGFKCVTVAGQFAICISVISASFTLRPVADLTYMLHMPKWLDSTQASNVFLDKLDLRYTFPRIHYYAEPGKMAGS